MPKPQEKALTYETVITEILRSVSGPLPAQELAEQMLATLPSQARHPLQAMRQHIRQANGQQLVFLDADAILPLRLAFQGVRFRLSLDRDIVDKGLVNISESLPSYLPPNFLLDGVQFVETAGKPIAFQVRKISQQVNSPLGSYPVSTLYASLSAWFRAQKIYAKDHLLVSILDWEQGILQLEREPFGQRNQELLAQRNQLLADLFYILLESATDESIFARAAVPTVYARLPDKSGYPPGHWVEVLEADGRMTSDGWEIHYSDSGFSPIERLARELYEKPRRTPSRPVSKEQSEQVYRFKAALVYRPKIWREIEIQGRQTLADLDIALREAFNHDVFDHLGGFWKLIPRGAQAKTMARRGSGRQTRFREVELGNVEPMGGGDGARLKIAGLSLVVGEQIKFVYDFGDWIEHHLTLQTIEAPQSGVKYPREAARNQPEFIYCVECQNRVATWICLECTTGPDEEVLLCEECSDEHAEHYMVKILY